MTREPFCKGIFAHAPAGDGEHGFHNVGLRGHDIEPIEKHESGCDNERYSLVSIYKRVIPRYTVAIARRQSRERNRTFVVEYIAWSKECGIEQPSISNAVRTTIARDLPMVNLQGGRHTVTHWGSMLVESTDLLREPSQSIIVFSHNSFGMLHHFVEICITSRNFHAVGYVGHIDAITAYYIQAIKDRTRQDNSISVPNLYGKLHGIYSCFDFCKF